MGGFIWNHKKYFAMTKKKKNVIEKEVEIIFCNFKSGKYELNDHVSEDFARYFLNKGCKDGENITELVKEKLHGRI